MTRVAITSVVEGVEAAFSRAMALADCDHLIRPGHRVLVKPNWNAVAIPGSTSMAAVEAACVWAFARKAGKVVVGEGPVPVGVERIRQCYADMDVERRLKRVGASFAHFDDGEHVLFRGLNDLPEEIGIARLATECDVIINMPLLKVHSCCLVSLCLKNVKGCLRPQDKIAFHRTGLLPAIVALNGLVRPQINVIDAIDGMEGEHNHGEIIHLGLFIAGRYPVAVDAVGCAQIGLDPHAVPLLRLASEAGLGSHHLTDIELVGEPLRPRRFELVQERLQRLCPGLEIDDAGACSACSAALMDGLYVAGSRRTVSTVALGEQARPSAEALVLGRCLRGYWATHRHVKGCPPSGHAVAQALIGEGVSDTGSPES